LTAFGTFTPVGSEGRGIDFGEWSKREVLEGDDGGIGGVRDGGWRAEIFEARERDVVTKNCVKTE
jgi:hypothetical protein